MSINQPWGLAAGDGCEHLGARILVLEDDRTMRSLLSDLLEEEGYLVEVASRGEEAVQRATGAPFDLLIFDIRMEGIDGLEALARIQQRGLDLPSLAITGGEQSWHVGVDEDPIRALRLGVGEYLRKPFRPEQLLEAVARLLQARRRQLEHRKSQQGLRQVASWALSVLLVHPPVSPDLVSVSALTGELAEAAGMFASETTELALAATILTVDPQAQLRPDFPTHLQAWVGAIGEHYDGSGPQKLRGNAIPLPARVVALARTAQADPRPVPELRRLYPGRFDPFLLEALERCLERKEAGSPARDSTRLMSLAKALLAGGDQPGAERTFQVVLGQSPASSEAVEASLGLAHLAAGAAQPPSAMAGGAREAAQPPSAMAGGARGATQPPSAMGGGARGATQPPSAMGGGARGATQPRSAMAGGARGATQPPSAMAGGARGAAQPPSAMAGGATGAGEPLSAMAEAEVSAAEGYVRRAVEEARGVGPVTLARALYRGGVLLWQLGGPGGSSPPKDQLGGPGGSSPPKDQLGGPGGSSPPRDQGSEAQKLLREARERLAGLGLDAEAALVEVILGPIRVEAVELLLRAEYEPELTAVIGHLFPRLCEESPRLPGLDRVLRRIVLRYPEIARRARHPLPQAARQALHEPAGAQLLRIHSFGGLQVRQGEQPIEDNQWRGPLAKHLFAFLAAQPRPVHEDVVLGHFWPEAPENSKRRLSGVLSTIRKTLSQGGGPDRDWIVRTRDRLGLDPKIPMWHDLLEFEKAHQAAGEALRAGPTPQAMAAWSRMATLHSEPYLAGCYMDWALRIREQTERQLIEALVRLAQASVASDPERGLEHARRALLHDPLQESAQRLIMQAHLKLGQPEKAVRHFARCQDLLRKELGTEPSIELLELYHRAKLAVP